MEESNDHDSKLEALFAREHTHLSAEPFVNSTLALVAAERRRAIVVRRVVQALGILALLVVTPWLIEASLWMSRGLEAVFVRVSNWLADPVAMVTVGVLLAVAWVFARRWRVRLAQLF